MMPLLIFIILFPTVPHWCVMPKTPRKDLDLVAQEISASITRQIGRFFFQNARITTVFAVIRAFHVGRTEDVSARFFPGSAAVVAFAPLPPADGRARHRTPSLSGGWLF